MYRIREILNQKGMTSKELAEKMGVTPQYISGIIRETGSASVEVLANIANILNVPVSSLFEDYVSDKNTIKCPKCGAKFELKEE
jgi:transcriptional regulator with XRE-family HTH domain